MSGYRMPFNQYKDCQKMTKNEFSRWIQSIWRQAVEEGYQQACAEVPDGSIVINPEDSVVVQWSEDEFRDMLLGVKGVGPRLAEAIIQAIYERYDQAGGQDETEHLK